MLDIDKEMRRVLKVAHDFQAPYRIDDGASSG